MSTMLTAAQTLNQQQTDVNKTEAAASSVFVAGWRPAIGWVCALALIYQYLLRPVVEFSIFMATNQHVQMPGLDDNLWELMFSMLGIGGLRTLEKFGGVHTQSLLKGK